MSVYLNPTDLVTIWNAVMIAVLAVHLATRHGKPTTPREKGGAS